MEKFPRNKVQYAASVLMILAFFLLHTINGHAQNRKVKNDSIAMRDSLRDAMFQGTLYSMNAVQALLDAQKTDDHFRKQQKSGESQTMFQQSRRYFRKAIGFNANYYPAWSSIGTSYLMENIPKASVPYFRKALSIAPDYSQAWFNLGKAYDMIGKRDSAVFSFSESIRTDSSSVKSYQELSRILMATTKDSAAALKLLRTAAHYQPASEVPYSSMAAVYFSCNDSVHAVESLEKAEGIYSGDLDRLKFLITYFSARGNKAKAKYYSDLLAVEEKKLEVPSDPDQEAGH